MSTIPQRIDKCRQIIQEVRDVINQPHHHEILIPGDIWETNYCGVQFLLSVESISDGCAYVRNTPNDTSYWIAIGEILNNQDYRLVSRPGLPHNNQIHIGDKWLGRLSGNQFTVSRLEKKHAFDKRGNRANTQGLLNPDLFILIHRQPQPEQAPTIRQNLTVKPAPVKIKSGQCYWDTLHKEWLIIARDDEGDRLVTSTVNDYYVDDLQHCIDIGRLIPINPPQEEK